jgi:hypothetical protein
VLGAIGHDPAVAPAVRPGLTPLAAGGLVILMTGATAITVVGLGGASARAVYYPRARRTVAYGRRQPSCDRIVVK